MKVTGVELAEGQEGARLTVRLEWQGESLSVTVGV